MDSAPLPPPPPIKSQTKTKWVIPESQDNQKWIYDSKVAKAANVDQIDWSNCIGFSGSSQGSEGAFFLGWEGNHVIVIKSSTVPYADLFATELGLLVSMPFPKMRLVRHIDDEFKVIDKTMKSLDELKKESDRGRAHKMLMQPVLTLIEYVQGKSLMEVTSVSNKECFEFGRIMSFDVLMNNWDRLPLIWDNSGNGENIITNGDSAIGIDHTISAIHPIDCQPQYEKYITKVRGLIEELNGEKNACVGKVREFIKNCVGFDVGNEGELHLTNGLKAGIKEIIAKIDRKVIEEVYDRVHIKVVEMLKSGGNKHDFRTLYGMTWINIDFVEGVLNELKKIA